MGQAEPPAWDKECSGLDRAAIHQLRLEAMTSAARPRARVRKALERNITDRVQLVDLIEASDLDGLVRFVDGLAKAREWDGIVELRDRCDEAVERGKQLWPAAQFAEYRLALDAPAPYAGPVVVEGAGRFALGPLWEVAGSSHGWRELAEHIPDGPARTFTAHERVVRGEDLTGDDSLDAHVLEVPFRVEAWEPVYPTAAYRDDKADFPEPDAVKMDWTELPDQGSEVDDAVASDALYDLTLPWTEHSNGRCETRAVEGDALSAISALGLGRARVGPLGPEAALAYMAWTGASGGAYGRRRGTPVGRHGAWWAVAALAGVIDEWPVPPGELGEALGELRWYRWDPGDKTGGWGFHLAVEDLEDGLAWAVGAVDAL